MSDILIQGFNQFLNNAQAVTDIAYKTACEAGETAGEFIEENYQNLERQIAQTGQFVEESYYSLGREVAQLAYVHIGIDAAIATEQTFVIVANIAKKTLPAIPITLGSLFLPAYITTPLWIGFGITHLIYENPFTPEAYDILNMGLGNASATRAAISIGQLATTGNPLFAISATINIIFAVMWYDKVNFGPSAPPPDDEKTSFISPREIPLIIPRPDQSVIDMSPIEEPLRETIPLKAVVDEMPPAVMETPQDDDEGTVEDEDPVDVVYHEAVTPLVEYNDLDSPD